jgi:hypothetical protein
MYIPRKFAVSDDETKAALAQAGFAQLSPTIRRA